MTIYRLRSFGPNGKIIGVQKFSADTDREAIADAREMVKDASAVAAFDLWEGERLVHGAAPTMRQGKPRPIS